MPIILDLVKKAIAFLKDMSDNIRIIYAEKGKEPFKKPLLYAVPVVFILYIAVYAPLVSRVKSKTQALEQMRVIAEHAADYKDAKTKLAAYQRKLPLMKDKDEWINSVMTSTAKNHAISFESISAQTESEVGNFILVSRIVVVTTTYAKLGKWVADLENSPVLIKVTDVGLVKDESRAGLIRVNLKISTVFANLGSGGKL